jgi:predicted secreted protein
MHAHVVPANAGTQRRCFWVALLATALTACSGPYAQMGPYWPIIPRDLPPPRVVGDSANGTTVDVVRTQWLNVVLPGEANSANRWTYVLGGKDEALLYPSGDTPRYESVVGAPGSNAIFTFRAEGTGTTNVTFVYRNRDDPQAAAVKTVSFDVVSR